MAKEAARIPEYNVVEREIIAFRAERRQQMRDAFQRQQYNPFNTEPHVFDPALQRYQAMYVSQFEYFKPTFKTLRFGLFAVVLPMAVMCYLVHTDRSNKERAYRNGEVAYKDRSFKFI